MDTVEKLRLVHEQSSARKFELRQADARETMAAAARNASNSPGTAPVLFVKPVPRAYLEASGPNQLRAVLATYGRVVELQIIDDTAVVEFSSRDMAQ